MITGNTEKNIRPPAVASMFYPGGTAELRNAVQKYLSNAGVEENVSQLKKEEIAELVQQAVLFSYLPQPVEAV